MTHIVGLAIPVGSLSGDLGGFQEIIAASALDRVLAPGSDLWLLNDHNVTQPVARRSAGTLELSRDHRGLRVVADVDPEVSYVADRVRAIRRRDVGGMSFAFAVHHVTWEERAGVPVRIVHDMSVRECSTVCWPAYAETEVSVRAASPAAVVVPFDRHHQENVMHDDPRLEVAAPGPGQRRDIAASELQQAKRWWATHPGRPLELRYAPPHRSRAFSTKGLAMARNRQKQAEAEVS